MNWLGEGFWQGYPAPRLIQTKRVFAYDFRENKIPGIRDYEESARHTRRGTIDVGFEAHQDLGREPKFDMFNPKWRPVPQPRAIAEIPSRRAGQQHHQLWWPDQGRSN